jgi:hypothetical protein
MRNVRVSRALLGVDQRTVLGKLTTLCDIFDCGPDDLVAVTAADARKKAASAGRENVVELNKAIRPKRARILSDDA